MESKRQKLVLFGSIILALLWLTPAVSANKVLLFYISPPEGYSEAPVIKVYSDNGEKWTNVDKNFVTRATLNMKVKCKFDGNLNEAYRGFFNVNGMEPVGRKVPIDKLLRPSDKVWRDFKYAGSRDINPVKICNNALQKKLTEQPNVPIDPNIDYSVDKKYRKYQHLRNGFKVHVPSVLKANFKLVCKPTWKGNADQKEKQVLINTIVDCQGTELAKDKIPKPRQPTAKVLRLTNLVSDVAYQATPENFVGICPRGIKFKGHITATRAGQAKYQYVAKDGRKSPVFSLNFDEAGTKATGNWSETVTKPEKSEVFTKKGFNTSNSVVIGWWQLTIVSPEMKKPLAATAKYTVTCQDKPAQSKIKN